MLVLVMFVICFYYFNIICLFILFSYIIIYLLELILFIYYFSASNLCYFSLFLSQHISFLFSLRFQIIFIPNLVNNFNLIVSVLVSYNNLSSLVH